MYDGLSGLPSLTEPHGKSTLLEILITGILKWCPNPNIQSAPKISVITKSYFLVVFLRFFATSEFKIASHGPIPPWKIMKFIVSYQLPKLSRTNETEMLLTKMGNVPRTLMSVYLNWKKNRFDLFYDRIYTLTVVVASFGENGSRRQLHDLFPQALSLNFQT